MNCEENRKMIAKSTKCNLQLPDVCNYYENENAISRQSRFMHLLGQEEFTST